MNKLLNSKKGANFFDVIELNWKLMALFISVVVILITLNTFESKLIENPNTPQEAIDVASDAAERYPTSFDWLALVIVFVSMIASVMIARRINSNPMYMAFALIFVWVSPLISMLVVNMYTVIASNVKIAAAINNMVIFPWIMTNLVYISLVYAVLISIFLFMKPDASIPTG